MVQRTIASWISTGDIPGERQFIEELKAGDAEAALTALDTIIRELRLWPYAAQEAALHELKSLVDEHVGSNDHHLRSRVNHWILRELVAVPGINPHDLCEALIELAEVESAYWGWDHERVNARLHQALSVAKNAGMDDYIREHRLADRLVPLQYA